MKKCLAIFSISLLMLVLMAQETEEGFIRLTSDDLEWTVRENGTSFVLLEGAPSAEGFYVYRVKSPPGSFTTPHYHSQDRYVTVISGTWYTGFTADGDPDKTVPLGAGSYVKHPAGGIHYDGAKDEEVIVEIRGIGPVESVYLEN